MRPRPSPLQAHLIHHDASWSERRIPSHQEGFVDLHLFETETWTTALLQASRKRCWGSGFASTYFQVAIQSALTHQQSISGVWKRSVVIAFIRRL